MSRNRRNQRPTPPRATPLISTTEARDLAADLIRELAEHAGDPDAVRAVLDRWLDLEDVTRLSMVCLAVVQTTYASCISRVPVDQIPAGALTLTAPTERTS